MGLEWPWILLLLPLPLALFLWCKRTTKNTAIELPPAVASALNEVNQQHSHATATGIRYLLAAIAWLALLLAISQPFRNDASVAQPVSGRALSLLIDLSTSMEKRDFTLNDEPVDRLTVVKHIAGQFITARQGDRVGLVPYGSEAFIASPLSFDVNAVNATLQSTGIGMAGRTTAMGDAMGMAIKSLQDDPAPGKAIVLLSDGFNNAGTTEPEAAAELAGKLGISVHTIGMGSEGPINESQQFQSAAADLDEQTLKSIAEIADGQFFRAQTTDELEQIYQEIDRLERADVVAPPLVLKKDYRNIFVLVTLVCMLALALHTALTSRHS